MFNSANETHFSLKVEDYVGDLQVLSFTGTEGISQAYRFDLELVSENPDLDLEQLLHKQAFLAFDPQGSGIHGQIYRVAQGDAGKRLTRYKVSIVPQLQYLHHRTNQRIYQQMSAPKIIALILEEHGIKSNAYSFQLSQPCPDRDYCVQYDETDLHFVQRLCEEEGIHYHFQHSDKGHLLVFGDDQTVFPDLGQPTAYVQGSGMVAEEPVIKGFKLRLETRTSRTTRRDYDFEKPRLQMEAAYRPDGESTEPDLEDYDYPGRFIDRARGKFLSQRALERHRADYRQAEGRGDQTKLVSGHFMEMSDHPRSEWNDLWLLTEIFHEGKQPQVLEEGVTSDTTDNKDDFHQWLPQHLPRHPVGRVLPPGPRTPETARTRQPDRHGHRPKRRRNPLRPIRPHQSAIPLGPRRPGRRQNQLLATRLQLLAGDRYGAISIPRIGMEVLVTFLEGDPDQPLVTGCLYHKENPVPYALPANKTRSVFKTLSSPGGGGYNELRIEDKKGAEQIYIHAQRDWDENVEHDQKIRVGNERHDTVVKNTYTELKAEEHRTTISDRKVEAKLDDHLTVGQNQHVKLGTAQLTSVGKEIHLKAGDKIVIEAGTELTILGGGSFIKLDGGGVTVVGPVIKINAGGSAGSGTGIGIKPPVLPGAADKDKAGSLMDQALLNAPTEKVKPKAFFVFSE